MARLKLTAAEEEFVQRHRARIELDARDWSKEPHVTYKQLCEMSPHVVQQVLTSQPNVWCDDPYACILRNVAHPDNADWWEQKQLANQLYAKEAALGYYMG